MVVVSTPGPSPGVDVWGVVVGAAVAVVGCGVEVVLGLVVGAVLVGLDVVGGAVVVVVSPVVDEVDRVVVVSVFVSVPSFPSPWPHPAAPMSTTTDPARTARRDSSVGSVTVGQPRTVHASPSRVTADFHDVVRSERLPYPS